MDHLLMLWLCAAVVTALGIVADMRRLRVNHVWISPTGWALLCACIGVFAVVPYLIVRRGVRRRLVKVVWELIDDETHSPELRYRRLAALMQAELIGQAIYHACLKNLDSVSRQPKEAVRCRDEI
ncbi:hypothetical protein [Burkholderia gladioli]|uniref:hypothetical protein n=1 Tax=Burkholderia gladioli TaxID=28095 RepID=UPI0016422B03|nr:hypothetical protein [Burkholderia gladioli]